MEPTGIEPVTSCLQNIWSNPLFPHYMRTSAEQSARGTHLSQHFRTWYGLNLEREHGEVTGGFLALPQQSGCARRIRHFARPGRKFLSTQTSLRRPVPAVNAMRVPSG